MDASQWVNVGALIVAFVSVVTSAALALRSARLTNDSNNLAFAIDLLEPHRSGEFLRKEKNVWNKLDGHDTSRGFFELPEPMASDVAEVAYYYNTLGYVSEFGFVDRALVLLGIQYRVIRTWE